MTSGRPRAWSICAGRRPASPCGRRTRIRFVADRIAMAHNGSIKPIGHARRAARHPRSPRRSAVTTDSERYFGLIRQHRASSPDLAEAVRRAVSQLRELFPDASLNALILGEDQLIAVHAHARSRLPDEDIAEITAADLPAEHLEDYFGMRWARPDEDKVVIASTGFGDLDWRPLEPESVTVDLDARPVDGDAAADDPLDAVTDETVAVRTSSALPTLSKAERRVGRTLLADYPSAGLASAARLAERAEVSPPTVLRFAQSLGYDGFTDLQVALRAELSALSSGPDQPAAGCAARRRSSRPAAAAGAGPERASRRNACSAADLGARCRSRAAVGHRADRISARRTLLASAGRAPGRPPRAAAAGGAAARRS